MSEDEFLDSLRDDARELRYDPGDMAIGRIEALVHERVSERETISGTLAGWLRPLAGAIIAATAISLATLVWLSAEPADALLAGAGISFTEDYYRVAQ